ncbi:rod shape-determining protein MreC [Lactobacillus corticis]|uniref:Cell shape-determining protein MreC n=1 Tax=Lactobacillus corticis TaxID=2201249 RepID=A0A916VI93_9LACO|nr:rod shape-determining protein MreC [Lactobacillus corticis]GFZ27075.1 rod shape-determining protein MreC [Lactobacillus corticis]
MKKFLENKKLLTTFVVILLVLIVLAGTTALRKRRNNPLVIQSFGNDVVSVGANIINFPLKLISNGATSVSDLLKVQEENNRLKKEVDELGQTQAENKALQAENKELKSTLKLKQTLTNYSQVTASVISRSTDTWSDLLVINKGKTSGIKKNMAVMSGGGVIGRIVEVNAATSKVELITTSDTSANRFAVEATAKNGKTVHGIISVDSSSQLSFTQVVDSRKLTKGTKVYTSGMGGNSPKGLLVGTVSTTTKDSYGLSDVIRINPAGNLDNPTIVTVIERKVS